jgi:hypothetical protein
MKHPIRDDIGDELLSAIGLTIVTASAVHYAMTMQLLRLINPKALPELDITPIIITLGMKVDTTLGLLKTLMRLKSPNTADDFDRAADKLRASFSNKRDLLAHNTWKPGRKPKRVTAYQIKTVGRFRYAELDLTEKQIRKWAAEIFEEAKKIDELISGAGFARLERLPSLSSPKPSRRTDTKPRPQRGRIGKPTLDKA